MPSARALKTRPDDPSLHVLESLVTYRLTRVADTIMRAAAQVYRMRHDVTVTELRLLATIGHHQPLALNEVSRLTGIDKAWVSRSLAALVKRELVSRQRHPTDSRVILLSLTRAGKTKVQQIVPLAVARNERLLAAVDRSRRAALIEFLDRIQVQAEDILATPGDKARRFRAGNGHARSPGRRIGSNGRAAPAAGNADAHRK